MSQTITKSIGQGFAKNPIYAALAYDSTDRFGGYEIKDVMFNTTHKAYFNDTDSYIYSDVAGRLRVHGNLYVDGSLSSGSTLVSLNSSLMGDLTVGVNGGGFDVTFYGTTPDDKWVWIEASDEVVMKGEWTCVGNVDITGTFTVAGNTTLTGTLTTNTADNGLDVLFHGDGDSAQWLWDASADTNKGGVVMRGTWVCVGDMDLTGDLVVTGNVLIDGGGILMDTTQKVSFADTNTYIYSSTTDTLDLISDDTLNLNATTDINLDAATINITGTTVTAFTYPVTIADTLTSSILSALAITTTSADTTGGSTVMLPLLVTATMTGAGGLGRAIEGKLIVNETLGGYANAIKGFIDITNSAGSSGLLAAVLAEMVLPDEAMAGTFAVLEIELIAPSSFTSSAGTGNDCVSFINTCLSGAAAGEIDEHGYFLNIQGLTDGTTELLYNNTLRCAIGSNKWYLPFSSAEGSFTTAYPIVSTYSDDIGCYLHVTTSTDATNRYGLYSLITAADAASSVWAVYGDVSWTGTGHPGLTGVNGRVTVGGDFTGGTDYAYGITGQLNFANGTTINNSASIFAATTAVITGETGGTYTTGAICGLFINNLFSKDISSKSGVWALLYMANNSSINQGPNDAIYLHGAYVTNFVNLYACENGGMVSAATTSDYTFTTTRKIRIKIDGDTYYLIADTA